MPVKLPDTPPPSSIEALALPAILSRLAQSSPSDPDLDTLQLALALCAKQSLSGTSPSLKPLQYILKVPSTNKIPPSALCDTIIAYPTHLPAIKSLLDLVFSSGDLSLTQFVGSEMLPALTLRLRAMERVAPPDQVGKVLRIILAFIRAHRLLLDVVLSQAHVLLPVLQDIYPNLPTDKAGVSARSDVLLICHLLVMSVSGSERESLKRLLGDPAGPSRRPLVEGKLRGDYEAVFVSLRGLQEEELGVLQALSDDAASLDPRVHFVTSLFPHLPASALLKAFNHEKYAPTTNATPAEAAAPLLDEILSGGTGLPEDLHILRDLVSQHTDAAGSVPEPTPAPEPAKATKVERRNIWNDQELDLSKLKIKDDESNLPKMGTSIPDHLRASIMRLVETQAEEEKELERALGEAYGTRYRADEDEDDADRQVKLNKGEDEDSEGDQEDGVKIAKSKPASSAPTPQGPVTPTIDPGVQSRLEVTYLSDPKVFGRDAATRRSITRAKLRQETGLDDGQLEGWKIMLERNPYKDAILSRHSLSTRGDNGGEKGKVKGKDKDGKDGKDGKGGGKGEGSNSGGGGGGSRGGRGGGGGRGRGANKGSRGHSNAARTRGHDKKMAKMGAGL